MSVGCLWLHCAHIVSLRLKVGAVDSRRLDCQKVLGDSESKKIKMVLVLVIGVAA